MTTRHAAGHHSGHVMPAVHVIRRRGGSFLVMMCGNRALTGRAAGQLIRRPCGSGKRRVEQNNDAQTDACGNRTPSTLIAEGHGSPDSCLIIHQKALPGRDCSMRCASYFRPSVRKQSAILRILTWRPARRRLESWLTAIFDWILARTRRRLSKRGTSWMGGGRPFASTKSCSTSWNVLRARPPRSLPSPELLPRRSQRRNPKEKQRKRPKAKKLPPNRASRLREKQRRPPTGKWACWSGYIFLRTKSYPNSAGWTASRPKSLSRALHRKLFIKAIRNSNRRTGNSKLLSNLTEARLISICEFEAKLAAKFGAQGLARSTNLD